MRVLGRRNKRENHDLGGILIKGNWTQECVSLRVKECYSKNLMLSYYIQSYRAAEDDDEATKGRTDTD